MLPSFTVEADLPIFRNGEYLIDFKDEQIADYRININNDEYIKYLPGSKIEGKIIKLSPELYLFKDKNLGLQVDTTQLGKLINKSLGEQCVEIKKAQGDKIYFRTTYVGTLHITLNEGMFVKK